MVYHAWMEYHSLKISRRWVNGSDFRGKTVGPVLFETVGIRIMLPRTEVIETMNEVLTFRSHPNS